MKRFILITAAAVTGLVGSVVAVSSAAAAPPRARVTPSPGGITWSLCPDDDPVDGIRLKGLECGSLQVPLDYSRPNGQKIALALTRAKHTAPDDQFQGIVLLNRGQWPGGIGRDLPTRYATGTTGLPTDVGSTYDWIGFDPRGVGASEPMVTCEPGYVDPGYARPDYVPQTAADEQAWLAKAHDYADSCAAKYGDVLKYLGTKDAVRDLDQIRQALGQEQLNYLGYDYGTYLGSVYASMFPNRVRRMVLDSVVGPSGVWYQAGLDKNVAFEKGAKHFFALIAKYDSIYQLGATEAEVEANYYKGMAMVRTAPIDGMIGPSEYTDVFSVAIYRSYTWVNYAKALSDWVVRQDPTGLKNFFGDPNDYSHHNKQAMYSAVQCRDAYWPRDWDRWHNDYSSQYLQGNTFFTWSNAWYNAPCVFWPVPAGQPPQVGQPNVNILLVQPQNDVAMPVAGAYETHARFANSRLVLERDGYTHSISLSTYGNACVNSYVIAYLRDGTRPASVPGADAYCAANPDPAPPAPTTP